ncbi:hypothetical protein EZS27_001395 [termite gut metagenome]|uniref:Integrase catalytic domain-containing protein n=1 Tax=termite gut metagenome TaxID=433724 RepID=A0A5J4SYE1_9ZZZZ
MDYYNDKIGVSYNELTSVMRIGTLRSLLVRGRVHRLNRGGGLNNQVFIDYSTLPEVYREKFEERFGNPVEVLEQRKKEEAVTLDSNAKVFYSEYRYEKAGEMVSLPESLQKEYTLNASVIKMLEATFQKRKAMRKSLGGATKHVFETIVAESEALRDLCGHTLPVNAVRLREKMNAFRSEGFIALLSGKVGNSNTLKISKEVGDYIIALKRSRVPIYTDTQLFEVFNLEAPIRGWKPLQSIRSLTTYLDRPDVRPLWYDAAYGELKAHQLFSRKNRTLLPSMRDSLWYSDGTKLNLYYKDFDEKGKLLIKTIDVYEVMDAYSEVLLGYHIGEENYETQYHAFRMAIQTAGHKPYELVTDNQGGHKKLDTAGFLRKICRVYRPTAPYSGQSKSIESVFGRFQSQHLHKLFAFTGQNITTKKENSRPNLEFVEANKDKLYTLQELKVAYAAARKEWNESAHPAMGISRMEMYQKSVNPETVTVNALDMVEMFWIQSDKPHTFTSSGLEITINKHTHAYEVYASAGVPDRDWRRKNVGRKFVVRYDPYCLTSIRLYCIEANGDLRFDRIAEPYMVVHRNIQEQEAGDMAFIHKNIWENTEDRIARQVAARAIEQQHGVNPEKHGLSRPKMRGVKKEVEEEINKRLKKYARVPEEVDVGKMVKLISSSTFDKVQEFDEQAIISQF